MRKILAFFFMLVIAGICYLAYIQYTGALLPTFGLPIGGIKADIRKQTKLFFENIKFKNLEGLKSLVTKDTDLAEITMFLDKTFEVPHEVMDLESFSTQTIEVNSEETRARIKVSFHGLNLNTQTPVEKHKILYLFYSKPQEKWLVDISNLSR